jgi:hypothetical protein
VVSPAEGGVGPSDEGGAELLKRVGVTIVSKDVALLGDGVGDGETDWSGVSANGCGVSAPRLLSDDCRDALVVVAVLEYQATRVARIVQQGRLARVIELGRRDRTAGRCGRHVRRVGREELHR